MKHGAVLLAVALFFISGTVAGGECDLTTLESDEFLLDFQVQEDGTAEMKVTAKIPYPYDCIAEKQWEGLSTNPKQCDASLVTDALFRGFDFFVTNTDCTFSYDGATSHLLLQTASITEKIAKRSEGLLEIRFDKWRLAPEKEGAKNTLGIALPEGSKIKSYFPIQNSTKDGTKITWNPIPSEAISIQYEFTGREPNYLPLIGLGLAAAIIIGFIGKKIKDEKTRQKKISAFTHEQDNANKELKQLKLSYLKRRITEKTYQEKVEKINIRLDEIKVEKDGLESKRKGKERLKKIKIEKKIE